MISVINDIHLGVKRRAGTTNQSRDQLEQYTFNEFKRLLTLCEGSAATVIAGDLFNTAKVGEVALYMAFRIICDHMKRCKQELILIRGNHDNRSETVNDMCSLELLYVLLKDAKDSGAFEGEVYLVYNEPEYFETAGIEYYIIPHLFNQQAFDQAIDKVPQGVPFLILHCNYDNYFAQGDHSLNLSKEQAKGITGFGTKILIAHEHHYRKINSDLIVLGNQFPTSIDDCLGGGTKYLHQIDGAGEPRKVLTWSNVGTYIDTPFDQIDDVPADLYQFIRVSGSCEKRQFAQVVRSVNDLRKRSSAFVVSNAVKIADQKLGAKTKEEIETIDIVGMLLSTLSEKNRKKVELCLND